MNISITLDIIKPAQKYLNVVYKISGLSGDSLTLTFPTWSPGSYLIRDFASQLESFSAHSAGRPITWEKVSKCHWLLHPKNKKEVTVSYRIYANELNVRGCYADSELVLINSPSVFVFPDDNSSLPLTLKINTPKSWDLNLAKKSKGGKYVFKNFDELFDTPILSATKLDRLNFSAGKTKYVVAIWGNYNLDQKKLIEDIKKIVSAETRVFRENPCHEYHFQVLFIPDKYGGLEHSHSSTNIFDGSKLHNPGEYKKFLSLLAHEHFHLWNVKRVRPMALGPFDYTQENYTHDLWVAEGITSYYDDHTLFRAGLFSQTEYLKLVSDNITKLESQKAYRVNSLSESSFDAWIRFYKPTENSMNTTANYYLKGALVMMLLDLYLIKYSRAKYSLDDVMLALYKLYKSRPEVGITRAEFFDQILKLVPNFPVNQFVSHFIDGTKAVAWPNTLAGFGIDVKKTKASDANFLGVILEQKGQKVFIKNMAEDSPAYKSILQPQDEIIAINDQRFDSLSQFDQFLKYPEISVLFSRLDKIHTCRIATQKNSHHDYKLELLKKMSPEQKKYLNKFLRKY